MMHTRKIKTATTLWYWRYGGTESTIPTRFGVAYQRHDKNPEMGIPAVQDLSLISVESCDNVR
jgi:hypothetical protein